MRLSTAVTLALTVLLATSMLGAVAAAPSARTPTVADRSPSEASLHDPAVQQSQVISVSGSASSSSIQDDQQLSLQAADPAQVIRINVTETGDAEWSIESRFLLTDDEDVETFESYAGEVTAGNRDVDYDRQLFENQLATAEQSTGRTMSIEGMGWDDPRVESIDDPDAADEDYRVGVISYSFTWTNFATTDGDHVYFGDAFETSQGPWLANLGSEQRLVIQSPPGYSFEEFNTPPTTTNDGAFIWNGPQQFENGDLDIVFVRVAGSPQNSWLYPGVALLVIVVAAAAAYFIVRRRSNVEIDVPPAIRDRLPVIGSRDPDAPATDPGAGPGGDRRTPDVGPAAAESDGGEQLSFEEPDDVDPELLSDEERVHRLLKRNGGRMKQGSIVTETGWSNAKVSQLLSQMDDDGEIEKLRIGRENLITLPEVDPTEID
ncbi:helix-turn-helix transcriptional regulator [Halosolutus amylolyticus]|uniref:Helix-turn-helix transcriptional regulator n=1 Tax=Halosolutus amylolyticus TaxID=2932267 RepID=A0ABD5PR19_9EURY|nr:hypothetical protein [Halosolutus amylolyticus]